MSKHRRPSWLARFKAARASKRTKALIAVRNERIHRQLAQMLRTIDTVR